MKKFFSRGRSKSSAATKFGEPSSPGEGKTGGGSRYPLKHTATNNNAENSDDDDRPEGLPSNNDAGSKNNAPNPTLRMSRTKVCFFARPVFSMDVLKCFLCSSSSSPDNQLVLFAALPAVQSLSVSTHCAW